jgi:hypothetical protein
VRFRVLENAPANPNDPATRMLQSKAPPQSERSKSDRAESATATDEAEDRPGHRHKKLAHHKKHWVRY